MTQKYRYQQALQQYLQYEHARKTEPVSVKMSTSRSPDGFDDISDTLDPLSGNETRGEVSSKDDLTPQILESVPKTLHKRAKLLLNKLKNNDVMTWNKNDELEFEGNVVKGSNVIDLVNDTNPSRVSKRKRVVDTPLKLRKRLSWETTLLKKIQGTC